MSDRSSATVHQVDRRSEHGMSKLDYNFQVLLLIVVVAMVIVTAGALGAMIGFLFLIG